MKKIIAIVAVVLLFWGLNKVHAAPAAEATAKAVSTTDVHDKKGKLVYQVKRYDESQLNKQVKGLVYTRYASFDITGVEEVVIPGSTESIYIIHLQNESSIKVVRVYNSDIEETGNYKRG